MINEINGFYDIRNLRKFNEVCFVHFWSTKTILLKLEKKKFQGGKAVNLASAEKRAMERKNSEGHAFEWCVKRLQTTAWKKEGSQKVQSTRENILRLCVTSKRKSKKGRKMKLYPLKWKRGEMEQGPGSPVVTAPHTGVLERKLHYLIKE